MPKNLLLVAVALALGGCSGCPSDTAPGRPTLQEQAQTGEAPVSITTPVIVKAYVPLDCGASQLFFVDKSGQSLYLYNKPFTTELFLSTKSCSSKPDMTCSTHVAQGSVLSTGLTDALAKFVASRADEESVARIRGESNLTKLTEQEQLIWGALSFVDRLKRAGRVDAGYRPEHKSLWERHEKKCFVPINARRMVSRSHRSFGPRFQGAKSFVFRDSELVALRYHVAFFWSADELAVLQKHFTPWFIVTYDLKDGKWSVEKVQTQQTTPTTFSNLQEAVTFIAACLDRDDFKKLSSACVGGRKPAVYLAQHRSVFDNLKTTHKKTPLQKLYTKRAFPKDADKLKLGGHAAELGHTHIDFVNKDGHWSLADIWECR